MFSHGEQQCTFACHTKLAHAVNFCNTCFENENTFFLLCFFFFALLFDSLFIFPLFLQKYKVKSNLWRELVQLCNVALCVSSSVRENNSLGIGHNFRKS